MSLRDKNKKGGIFFAVSWNSVNTEELLHGYFTIYF